MLEIGLDRFLDLEDPEADKSNELLPTGERRYVFDDARPLDYWVEDRLRRFELDRLDAGCFFLDFECIMDREIPRSKDVLMHAGTHQIACFAGDNNLVVIATPSRVQPVVNVIDGCLTGTVLVVNRVVCKDATPMTFETETVYNHSSVQTAIVHWRCTANDLHAAAFSATFGHRQIILCHLHSAEGTGVEPARRFYTPNCFRDSRTCQCTNPSILAFWLLIGDSDGS